MANPVNELAMVQDQFQLMALSFEKQDENEARMNSNFLVLFKELQKNMSAMSERILVLEQEKAMADTKAVTIAKAHLETEKALSEQVSNLTLRLNETTEKIKTLEFQYKHHIHLTAHRFHFQGGSQQPMNTVFGLYDSDRTYTDGPVLK